MVVVSDASEDIGANDDVPSNGLGANVSSNGEAVPVGGVEEVLTGAVVG